MAFLPSFLPGFGAVSVSSLEASGTVTATGGFVGNVTGNVAGNLTGLVDGVDIDTKAPLASPTFTGSVSAPTLNVSGDLNLLARVTGETASPAQITANNGGETDYTGFGSDLYSRVSTDASRNIYSATGASGMFQWIINVGSQNLVFVHDDGATGTAALRFSLKGGANYTLAPGAMIGRYYDPTTARWRLTQP